MNIYKLSLSGVNVNEGINRFNGNAAVYEKFLKKFPDDINFSKLCDSVKAGNASEAFKSAHALKGIAGNLSMSKLYTDIFPLVEKLRNGNLENAEALLTLVSEDYAKVINAIKETL